jgi:signal transduction histidine kinase
MDATVVTPVRGSEPEASRIAARRASTVRGIALAYTLLAAGLLLLTVPLVFSRLQQACVESPCIAGQLTTSGIQDLASAGVTTTVYAAYILVLVLSVPLVGLSLALTVAWQRPTDRMALFLALFFATCPVGFSGIPMVLADLYPWLDWLARFVDVSSLAFWPLFCVFPDGRFVPRWSRWLLIPHALLALTLLAPSAFTGIGHLGAMQAIWMLTYSVAIVGFQAHRYRHVADESQRRQLRLVLAGLVAIAVSLPLASALAAGTLTGAASTALTTTIYTASVLLCMATLWIALLRYHLFDIALIVNRTLVYGALTANVIGIYALVVGSTGAVLRGQVSFATSLLGAGVVAVLFQPLRSRLQRSVDRLMYGDRDDPYGVLTQLSSRLESTFAPRAVLPTLVETVRETLKLPYAAVALATGDRRFVVRASDGVPLGEPIELPLTYQGEVVGKLLVTARSGETALAPLDYRLLTDLTRHAGVAVHALQLTDELQRAREALVTAREEERRRLRRDMHDGLGPALATMTLQSDTARGLIRADPDEAEALLEQMTAQAQETMGEVRRLIHALRPPVLDDLGLIAALRGLAASFGQGAPPIVIEAPLSLPPLPAAVEVAVYRITQEALTNVVKHSRARHCAVSVRCDDTALYLRIEDDGSGIGEWRTAGVGLASMRERAEELGGMCLIEPGADGGTSVRAHLPLRGSDGTDPHPDR